jgi:plasmid stability protein
MDLPDELLRAVKIRAVNEGRRFKDVMADVVRRGLADDAPPAVRTKVRLPLVRGAHPARSEDEMTTDRVAEVVERDDVAAAGPLP